MIYLPRKLWQVKLHRQSCLNRGFISGLNVEVLNWSKRWRRKVDIAIFNFKFDIKSNLNFLIDRGTRIFLFGTVFLNQL